MPTPLFKIFGYTICFYYHKTKSSKVDNINNEMNKIIEYYVCIIKIQVPHELIDNEII